MAELLELYRFTDGRQDNEHRFTREFIVKMWQELYNWDSARSEDVFRQKVAGGKISRVPLRDVAAGVKP